MTAGRKIPMSNEIAAMNDNEKIHIINRDGKLVISSLEIAKGFNKRHDNVMRLINGLISTEPHCKDMFIPGTYKNAMNQEYPCYFMDRDGFSMLAMGFTGKDALVWKVKYINAFNAMEKTIQTMNLDSYRIEDPVLRARRWIEEHQQAVEMKKKLEIAAPKAETFDRICTAQASMNFTEAAKILGIKRTILIDALERHMYLFRNRNNVLTPYAQYSETGNGIFILRRIPYGASYRTQDGRMKQNTTMQTYITMNGMDKLRRLMKRWGVTA